MKKFNLFFAFVCVFAMSAALFAQDAQEAAPATDPVIAEEGGCDFPLRASITLSTDTKYVCDGMIVTPDQVASYDFCFGAYGLYIDFWGQYDMTDYNDRKYNYEELDYTIGYDYTFDCDFSPITVGAAWQYYEYPDSYRKADGSELRDRLVKVSVSLDKVWGDEVQGLGFGGVFKYNYEDNQSYGDLWANYTYAVNEKLTAGVKGFLHIYDGDKWADTVGDYKGCGTRIHGFEIRPNVSYKYSEHLSFSGYVAANYFVTKSARSYVTNESANDHKPNTWAGVSATFSF